ncbi:MAG: substrate-binding domain-containing protein [Anaerolineae bacterium]|nr:substrate-binding domain-containing protein [Anaerolineae bacterium]
MNATEQITLQQTGIGARSNLQQRHLAEKIAFGVLWLAAGFVILVLFFVIFYLLLQGGKFFVGTETILENAVSLESNEDIRETVATTPYAIGYISFGYLDDSVNAVKLNGVSPTAANVSSEAYPVMRALYLLTSDKPEGAVAAWLDFARSSAGQKIIAEAGYIPLQTTENSDAPVFISTETVDFSGEVSVSGSTTLQPVVEELVAAFTHAYAPDLTFTIEGNDSSEGIKATGKGNVDVGMTSRDVKDVEANRYKSLQTFSIAYDGIAIIVNPALNIHDLTVNQVRDIFSGAIDNWKKVGGPDAPIVVISREAGSGTLEGFQKWVMSKDLLIEKGWQTMNIRLVAQGIGASFKFLWRFLTTRPLPGMGGHGGISTTIVTTIYMVILTLVVATPLGVGAGVYLVEYAGEMGGQAGGEEAQWPAWSRVALIGGVLALITIWVLGWLAGQFWLMVAGLASFALVLFLLVGIFYEGTVPGWWQLMMVGVGIFLVHGAGVLLRGTSSVLVSGLSYMLVLLFVLCGLAQRVGLLRPLVDKVGPRVVPIIRFAVETLAGVPSIIFGLFGFALFVTVMQLGLSMLSGALAGACLILPVLIRTTEEALLTVPRSYREGSLSLGATKWQTIWQVVLPSAMPGIVTGIVLGVGRIVSETAVFYVTLGGSINLPESVMDQGRTMVLHLYSLMMDANAPEPAMGTAVVIVVTVILINLAINYFSNQLAQRMRGRA